MTDVDKKQHKLNHALTRARFDQFQVRTIATPQHNCLIACAYECMPVRVDAYVTTYVTTYATTYVTT